MVPTTLSILHLEDDRLDAELVQRALTAGQLICEISLVTSLADFIAAISEDTYDLIFSDYKLPDGDGLQAYKIARQKAPDTPFVLVTGALGEELAIETIKRGVDDYVLKNNLQRLVATVPNVVEKAREKWEKKLALEELRLSEERFNLAVKGSGAGLWDWPNPDQEAMWWSARTFELLGLEDEQIAATQKNFIARIHADDLPAYQQAHRAHLELQQTFDVEFRVIHPDNSLHWLRAGGQAVWDKSGKPTRMAGYLKDVSDYKQAEEERRRLDEKLRQSQKMEALGTLASGIAHDFNNMLASIIGYSALLAGRFSGQGQEYQDLQEIQKAAERAKQLVRQILTFSRKSEQQKVPVQLDQVIDETLKMLRSSIPATIKIQSEISAAGECILGDKSQLHQILMNLCVNAYHAMPEGGTLDLLLEKTYLEDAQIWGLQAGFYLKLEVADSGTGIAPEHLDKIFDPYFTTKDVDTGTGLGLSIVCGVIRDLKGDIKVKSSTKGTKFTLYLPCHQEKIVKLTEDDKVELTSKRRTILFVDDDPTILNVGQEFLQDLGYHVTGETRGVTVLQRLKAGEKYDVLITDYTMPQMTGIELAAEIFKFSPQLPIILSSGFYLNQGEDNILATGIRKIVLKTELFDVLPAYLNELFEGGMVRS